MNISISRFFQTAFALVGLIAVSCTHGNRNQSGVFTAPQVEYSQDSVAPAVIQDFSLPSSSGETLSIANEVAKHKLTIIDFWASWCGPCMKEMPMMKNLYDTFEKQGLGIVGISLDKEKDKWLTALQTMGISWTNLSDMKGWESDIARFYEVSSIPYTMVVDSNGTIVAGGLRGESLRLYIEKHINK